MPFEVLPAGTFGNAEGLALGTCSLGRNSTLMCHASDLDAVGITHYATVLIDRDNKRVGLREPRDGEQSQSVACSVVSRRKGGTDTGRRRVLVTRALKELGLNPADVAGRYELIKHGNEVVYIALANGGSKGKKS